MAEGNKNNSINSLYVFKWTELVLVDTIGDKSNNHIECEKSYNDVNNQ